MPHPSSVPVHCPVRPAASPSAALARGPAAKTIHKIANQRSNRRSSIQAAKEASRSIAPRLVLAWVIGCRSTLVASSLRNMCEHQRIVKNEISPLRETSRSFQGGAAVTASFKNPNGKTPPLLNTLRKEKFSSERRPPAWGTSISFQLNVLT